MLVVGAQGAVEISAGEVHTCARWGTGEVKCWGGSDSGPLLGHGSQLRFSAIPAGVVGLADAVEISAGGSHTCARLGTGQVRCWGMNSRGQLGDGTQTARIAAVPVQGISDAVEISAGGLHTCARLRTGEVKCWGRNGRGQLGDGRMYYSTTPVTVRDLSQPVEISAGGSHTCARLATGQVRCWGSNARGQLGDCTTTDRRTPVTVRSITGAVEISVSGGEEHGYSCVRLSSAEVKCWGWSTRRFPSSE